MGCNGSKANDDSARVEWDELVAKNTVAKHLDTQWKALNSGTRGETIQWATEAEGAVSAKSVAEIEAHFRKYVDFEAAQKEGAVEIFKFENGTGAPDAIEAEAAEEEFETSIATTPKTEEPKTEEELEKKIADGTATEDEKKEVEAEHKKEELEKKIEGGEKTPATFRAFLQNGFWAHKPAAMKAGQTGGRTFGGGWKRRYLALAKGEDVLDYGEGPGKPSKGTITFQEIQSVEVLTTDEAKQAKAPAKVAEFSFVIKTSGGLRYNFGCETADDANLAVEGLKELAVKETPAAQEEAVCTDGLLKVSVSTKPKEGKKAFFYHQFQYHLTKEEVKEEAAKEEKAEEKKEAEAEKKEEEAQKAEEKADESGNPQAVKAAEEKKEEAAEEKKEAKEAEKADEKIEAKAE